MKACIITIVDHINIGNRLQNYATQELLKAQGCDVSTLVYATADEEGTKLYQLKAFLKNLLVRTNIFTSPFYIKHIKKSPKMLLVQEFNKKYVKLTSRYFFKTSKMAKYRDDFDYYCAGSDQIWNPSVVQSHDFFFMQFAPSERTFSLCASMGASWIPEKYREIFRRGFEHVGHIAVRETSVQQIIRDMTGRESTVLPDPTLLIDKNQWHAIARKPAFDLPEQYIATYFLSALTPAQQELLARYALENGLRIIDINQTYDQQVGPLEFLYLIEHADFVFTDSFHGTAFSILFDKDFLVFQRNHVYDMSSRITTILETVRLENRFYRGDNNLLDDGLYDRLEQIQQQDTHHVGSILEAQKQKADAFLKSVFAGKDRP